jgi:hypothetical protein
VIIPRVSVEYAAGFFDGEGSIHIRPAKPNRGWMLGVVVSQMDRTPLDGFAARWGGTVQGPKTNGQHEWRACSRKAREFLTEIRPHLIVKAEAADIALEFGEGIGKTLGCKGIGVAETARRHSLRNRLMAVNRRRPGVPA